MKIIKRKRSVLTDEKSLEHLYTIRNFPVFMGCTNKLPKEDLKSDMSFSICKSTGIIQLDNLLPLDIVYQDQHNDGVGKIWNEHYISFADFCKKYNRPHVLEIGGATDNIGGSYIKKYPSSEWTILEPHPQLVVNKKIRIIKKWFGDFTREKGEYEMIVHSHVFEHMYDPREFLYQINKQLKNGGLVVFSLPNMFEQLSHKYTNCLNFEHTCFLAEPFVDALLKSHGFKILKKSYFKKHSIFYAAKKTKEIDDPQIVVTTSHYKEFKKIFNDFTSYHLNLVDKLNKQMSSFNGKVFLFGAHIFSQYLLAFGLNNKRIEAILDNSPLKQNKRLYGSRLLVKNPKIIKKYPTVAIILKVGAYRDEILRQAISINPKVTILE